jgi:hypothetical protein
LTDRDSGARPYPNRARVRKAPHSLRAAMVDGNSRSSCSQVARLPTRGRSQRGRVTLSAEPLRECTSAASERRGLATAGRVEWVVIVPCLYCSLRPVRGTGARSQRALHRASPFVGGFSPMRWPVQPVSPARFVLHRSGAGDPRNDARGAYSPENGTATERMWVFGMWATCREPRSRSCR